MNGQRKWKTQINLEVITLSEISQTEKDKHYMIPLFTYMWNLKKLNSENQRVEW